MLLTRAGFRYGSDLIVDTVVGLEEVMILGEEEGGKGVRREGKQHRSISVRVLFPRKSDMNEASVRVYMPHHIKAIRHNLHCYHGLRDATKS